MLDFHVQNLLKQVKDVISCGAATVLASECNFLAGVTGIFENDKGI